MTNEEIQAITVSIAIDINRFTNEERCRILVPLLAASLAETDGKLWGQVFRGLLHGNPSATTVLSGSLMAFVLLKHGLTPESISLDRVAGLEDSIEALIMAKLPTQQAN